MLLEVNFTRANKKLVLTVSLRFTHCITVLWSVQPRTLTCVSSGGPVNTVTWTRNGAAISSSPYQVAQSLEDGETSTYHNLLTVTSEMLETTLGPTPAQSATPEAALHLNKLLLVCTVDPRISGPHLRLSGLQTSNLIIAHHDVYIINTWVL